MRYGMESMNEPDTHMVSGIEAIDFVLERLEARLHLPDGVESFLVCLELERGAP